MLVHVLAVNTCALDITPGLSDNSSLLFQLAPQPAHGDWLSAAHYLTSHIPSVVRPVMLLMPQSLWPWSADSITYQPSNEVWPAQQALPASARHVTGPKGGGERARQ